MAKIRTKLLTALLFSTILHVGIFSILYMDFGKTDVSETKIDEAVNTLNKKDIIKINNDDALDKKVSRHIITNKIDSDTMLEVSQKKPAILLPDDPGYRNNENEIKLLKEANINRPLSNSSSVLDSDKTLQQTQRYIAETSGDIGLAYDDILNNQVLTKPINSSGLLRTDVPQQKIEVDTNQGDNLLKAEVEQMNTQLSAAIDEVKKRNQQKISQIRQQQSYTSSNED